MKSKYYLELLKQRIICSEGPEYFNCFCNKYYFFIKKDLEILEKLKKILKGVKIK